jgi:CBS domain-containing protein
MPISKVAKRMLEENLNTLPVVEEGNELTGVISTTDFTTFAANKFQLPEKTE